jgi:hypothetical protein
MSIESVAAELRTLRRRIDNQQANRHTWPTKEEELAADIDRYDRRLLKAATMLQIEVDARAGRSRRQFLLGDAERLTLEERLAGAGLDVRAADEDLQT